MTDLLSSQILITYLFNLETLVLSAFVFGDSGIYLQIQINLIKTRLCYWCTVLHVQMGFFFTKNKSGFHTGFKQFSQEQPKFFIGEAHQSLAPTIDWTTHGILRWKKCHFQSCLEKGWAHSLPFMVRSRSVFFPGNRLQNLQEYFFKKFQTTAFEVCIMLHNKNRSMRTWAHLVFSN